MNNESDQKIQIDFIGIGTNKSATTWITKCLSEHPDICMSYPKETHMFGKKYAFFKKLYKGSFRHCNGGKIRGEFTPNYMIHKEAAFHINKHVPDVKLIACLRNPIERITSAYNYGKTGRKPVGTFETYVRNSQDSCRYFEQLNRFLSVFPKNQLLILFYEDIKDDPQKFISSIYAHIGADPTYVPHAATTKVNITASNSIRFPVIHKVILWLRSVFKKSSIGKIFYKPLYLLGVSKWVSFILKKNTREGSERIAETKIKMEKELQLEVIDHLLEDILKLEKLTGRDLTSWKVVIK